MLDYVRGHKCFAWYEVRILGAQDRPSRVWAINAPAAAQAVADELDSRGKAVVAVSGEAIALVRKRGQRQTFRVTLTAVDLTSFVATNVVPIPPGG